MAENPKKTFKSFAGKFGSERWGFTSWELKHPEGCRGNDYFVAPLPPEFEHLGVLVKRDGSVTLRWADDGMPGVPSEALQYVDNDILFKICPLNPAQNEEDEEITEWRNVICDLRTGRFVRFGDADKAIDVIEHELHH